eukprot:TRINITY_DN42279_c0_g1_i1.p1 TRINITY_DN42279_c0_g1~~TRINITY_DN42279_c0_g1_i1.p1  ORF type:complete len:210 (+),score=13.24 TRINITY_DN42279_c0_g1_i1:33-632(+)
MQVRAIAESIFQIASSQPRQQQLQHLCAAAAAGALLIFWKAILHVPQCHCAVIRRWGHASRVCGSGWHVFFPLIEKSQLVSTKPTTETVAVKATSSDQESVAIVFSISHAPIPESLPVLLSSEGIQRWRRSVAMIVVLVTQEVVSRLTAKEVHNRVGLISALVPALDAKARNYFHMITRVSVVEISEIDPEHVATPASF